MSDTPTTTVEAPALAPLPDVERLVNDLCRMLGYDRPGRRMIVREVSVVAGGRVTGSSNVGTGLTEPDRAGRAILDSISYVQRLASYGERRAGHPPSIETEGQIPFAQLVMDLCWRGKRAGWETTLPTTVMHQAWLRAERVLREATQGQPGFQAPRLNAPEVVSRSQVDPAGNAL